MKYIAWGLLTVVTGLIFWLALIFVVSFLQLNGVLLNDTIQIEATFKDFTWVEFVAAFGTFSAAVAAAISAFAANKSSKLSEATLSEMEKQRESAELIAKNALKTEKQKQNNIANADKAMISFAVIGISDFLRDLAKVYEQIWQENEVSETGRISLRPGTSVDVLEHLPSLPMESIAILHQAANTNPQKVREITYILHWTQVHYSRVTGIQKDMQTVHVLGSNCFKPVIAIAETQVQLSSLLSWGRGQDATEHSNFTDTLSNALVNLRLDVNFTDAIEASRNTPEQLSLPI